MESLELQSKDVLVVFAETSIEFVTDFSAQGLPKLYVQYLLSDCRAR
jgi:hypothetical protein